MTGSLTFQSTTAALIFSVTAVIITAILCWSAWSRSGFARGTGILEFLRLSLAIMVAVTLNQPEWIEEFKPDEEPTLVVLSDISESMLTQDVIDEDRPAEEPKTRADWIKPYLAPEAWARIGEDVELVFESFSSTDGEANGTDLHAALLACQERHSNLRGIVLLTDGDWNMGDSPAVAATQLRMKNVPVFAVGVGAESRLPDVEVLSVDAPTFGVAGKTTRIPFVIRSSLPRDYEASVTLKSSDGQEQTRQVIVPAMGQLNDALTWHPGSTGDFELTLSIPVQETERLKENNARTVPIAIRNEALQVLLIESYPRWEYRYFRNALERDPGVEVSCLLFHPGLKKVGGGRGYLKEFPDNLEELQKYDVIMIGDIGVGKGMLTPQQCKLIKGLVQNQASGLIFMPGFRGHQVTLIETELNDLLPIVFDEAQPRGWGSRVPSQFELTETGRQSLLTKLEEGDAENARLWESLPGFQWYAPVLRARAGSETLAVHKTESNRYGRVPLLVTKTFGTGKILFMGTDGAWRWREGVEDKYHYRFWGQVARWMAYQRNMAEGEAMRLFYSPDRPGTGDVITLNANVMSTGGEPLQTGHVVVQILSPTGKTDTVRLMPQGDEWGLFSGRFTPEDPGEYEMTMTCRENGATLTTRIAVQGVSREKQGEPARYDVLAEVASITRGELVSASALSGIQQKIADLPEPEAVVRRLRIWCHILWAGALILLLGAFWTGRKMVGVI